MLNYLDAAILTCVICSALIGLVRGFVREAVSLGTWALAITLGVFYSEPLSKYFSMVKIPFVRVVLAFAVLVLLTLVLSGVLNFVLAKLMAMSGLNTTDRVIGMIFGLVRGIFLVSSSLLIVQNSFIKKITNEPIWQDSHLVPYVHVIAKQLQKVIPYDLVKSMGN